MTFNIPSLRDKAITVRLTRRMYNPYRYDARATAAAETATGTQGAGRFSKRLLRHCPELKKATAAYNDLYQFVIENTLPWMDDGVRVLPNANYMDFVAELAKLRSRADAAVQKLFEAWDVRVAEDKNWLGGMWDPHDYPTKSDMLEKWGNSITFAPVPSSDDFRIDMDDEDKRQLDEAVQEVQDQAGDYLLKQILAPVAAMADKLAVPIGEEGSVFRDTLVTNLQDVCKRAKKLNINGDERVAEIVNQIESITNNLMPSTLRESEVVRATTSAVMAGVRSKINAWF